jgi:sec-independent protein translocase protein TatA
VRRRELMLASAAMLAAPAAARANPPTEGAVLLDLIRREQSAKLAYSAVLKTLGSQAPQELVTIRQHESDHADALTTELAAVGLGRPLRPPLTGTARELAEASERRRQARGRAGRCLSPVARPTPRREDRDDRRDDPGLARSAPVHRRLGGRGSRQLTCDYRASKGNPSMPFAGNIGPAELIVVLVIALLVIGPKRLPEVGKSLGKGMREFKDSLSGDSRDEDEDKAPLQKVN